LTKEEWKMIHDAVKSLAEVIHKYVEYLKKTEVISSPQLFISGNYIFRK